MYGIIESSWPYFLGAAIAFAFLPLIPSYLGRKLLRKQRFDGRLILLPRAFTWPGLLALVLIVKPWKPPPERPPPAPGRRRVE